MFHFFYNVRFFHTTTTAWLVLGLSSLPLLNSASTRMCYALSLRYAPVFLLIYISLAIIYREPMLKFSGTWTEQEWVATTTYHGTTMKGRHYTSPSSHQCQDEWGLRRVASRAPGMFFLQYVVFILPSLALFLSTTTMACKGSPKNAMRRV